MGNISNRRDRLGLVAAAFLFSTGGVAIKVCSMTAWQVASFRSAIAALVLAILIPCAWRKVSLIHFGIGCAYGATMVSFVVATKLTTAANAIFLQSTAPLYMLVLGPLVLREKIRGSDLAVFAGVAAGAVLLLKGSLSSGAGDVVALLSGFTWAITLTGLRWLAKRDPDPGAATPTMVIGNAIAFASCLPFALPVGHAGAADVAVIFYLGIFQIALAYVFLTRSVRRVPAFEAATLLLIEPVFNPTWTWIFQGEQPGWMAVIGGSLILTAALGGTWWKAH